MKALKTLNPIFGNTKYCCFGEYYLSLPVIFSIYKVQFVGKSVDELTKNGNLGFNQQVLIYVGIIVGCSLLTGFSPL
jgi:ATP-binding cassette subfamily B protein